MWEVSTCQICSHQNAHPQQTDSHHHVCASKPYLIVTSLLAASPQRFLPANVKHLWERAHAVISAAVVPLPLLLRYRNRRDRRRCHRSFVGPRSLVRVLRSRRRNVLWSCSPPPGEFHSGSSNSRSSVSTVTAAPGRAWRYAAELLCHEKAPGGGWPLIR